MARKDWTIISRMQLNEGDRSELNRHGPNHEVAVFTAKFLKPIQDGHSRESVRRTRSMRGPKPHRLLQAIPEKSQQAPRTGIEPVFAWFRARCNDQQLPPRCKTLLSTPSGNRTRSAGFKGPRRVYAPERIATMKAPAHGLEPSLVSLTGSRPTEWATPDCCSQKSGRLDLNQRSRAPEARGIPSFPTS